MRRQMTAREWLLLALLGIILLVSGYTLLFYRPMTAERDLCRDETELCKSRIEAAQLRLEEKRRMERELEELFAANPNPLSIAPYDNLKPVMLELNSVLQFAREYSLSFGTVNTEEEIVRRRISLSFSCDSYGAARQVLGRLRSSAYRCMLGDVSIAGNAGGRLTLGSPETGAASGPVSVSAELTYFEYR